MSENVLELQNLTMKFGGVTALNEVNLVVKKGEILALIGPNGAGKTTVFNVITGVYKPTSGDVLFQGKSILGMKRHKITKLGIARTFQNIRLFGESTALENVVTGADVHSKTGVVGSIFGTPRSRREEKANLERALELLEFIGIKKRAGQLGKNLPYGDQRRLEIARALATNPKLLLLDEPAAGFNPAEKVALAETIKKIRDAGYTILLIEHDMSLIMGVSDRVVVLDLRLEIKDLHVHYGKIEAIKGVSIVVNEGEIVTLIGANGAGKTTMLKTISGLRPVTSGEILFNGEDISKMPAHKRADLGLSQAPEGRGIFVGMSVLENLEMGKYNRKDRKKEMAEDLEKVYHLFPRLKERAFQAGGTLSGGEQQMLAIGRALMSRPKVLLLDEPSMGLAPLMIQNIFNIITEINKTGVTILLVEQNAQQALQRAHRAYVLEVGHVVKEAKASDLLNDPAVRAAYLGTGAH